MKEAILYRQDGKAGKKNVTFLPVNKSFDIGRDEACDIKLDLEGVSRKHATIWSENGQYFIKDCKSTNGIRINGKQMDEAKLYDRDKIKIDTATFVFKSKRISSNTWALIAFGLIFLFVFAALDLIHTQKQQITEKAQEYIVPQASFNQLLNSKDTDWFVRTYAENPAILVIAFPSLKEQAQALNRAVAFIEKEGAPKDRVMGDVELAAFIFIKQKTAETFSSGFDFTNQQLAYFFNQAIADRTIFTNAEKRLLYLLIKARHLKEENDRLVATIPEQTLLTFVPSAFDSHISAVILTHELSHGRFFTDSNYREKCVQFWHQFMSEDERKAFKLFLAERDYDLADEVMTVINEMQAWLMFTPEESLFNSGLIGISQGNIERLRRDFQAFVLKSL